MKCEFLSEPEGEDQIQNKYLDNTTSNNNQTGMVNKCVVDGCCSGSRAKTRNGDGMLEIREKHPMHKFPQDAEWCAEWLRAIGHGSFFCFVNFHVFFKYHLFTMG